MIFFRTGRFVARYCPIVFYFYCMISRTDGLVRSAYVIQDATCNEDHFFRVFWAAILYNLELIFLAYTERGGGDSNGKIHGNNDGKHSNS